MSSAIPAIFEFPGVIITPSKLEMGVIKMLRRVRPDWRKEDIILQAFHNPDKGSLNISLGRQCKDIIYGGYTCDRSETVMLKIFQPVTNDQELSENSLKHMKEEEIRLMRLFAYLQIGPRLFATFSNGIAYENAPGVPLDFKLAVDVNVYPLIAQKIGHMHRILRDQLQSYMRSPSPYLTTSSSILMSNVPNVFRTLRNWLTKVPTRLADPKNHEKMKRQLPSKGSMERELSELEMRILQYPKSPISPQLINSSDLQMSPQKSQIDESEPMSFCHGNLNLSNIVYDATTNNVQFIELQFAAPNYQAFEIAQYFMTMCGSDMSKVGREEFVPAKEFQLRWCQSYLSGLHNIPLQKVAVNELEKLYSSVQKFCLVYCLQEVIWSLVTVESPTAAKLSELNTFDVLEYGIKRFQQYHRNKYNVLSFNI